MLALALAFPLLAAAPSAVASPSPTSPSVQIQDAKTAPGILQYVFSATNLPSGSHLDTKTVVVKAGSTVLDATAAEISTSVGPQTTVSREAILVLDVSGSMGVDGMAGARSAALAYARALPPDVRVGLITFNDNPHPLLAPTLNRKALAHVLDGVTAGGGTSLYDAVQRATNTANNLPVGADRRLLILSDGADTSSKASLSDAIAELKQANLPADVVAFHLPGNHAALSQIAAASGGKVLPANSAAELSSAFNSAAQAFRQQVLVTVQVPDSLALRAVSITTSMNAGSESVSASHTFALPAATQGATTRPGLSVTHVVGKISHTQLYVILGISFAGLLFAALIALFLPLLNAERNRKQARLAEVHRYRMVELVGTPMAGPALAAPVQQQTVIAERALQIVDKTVRARGQRERLINELDRSGLRMRPEEWAVIQLSAVVVGAALVAVLMSSPLGLLFGAVVGFGACRWFISFRIRRRLQAFEDQLPDTLQLLAGSLRSGFSMSQALTGIVREGTEPTAGEFSRALTEVRIGAELEDALDNVASRMRSEDLGLVVMAIRISREVGGNLAEVIQNTVLTMRERAQLRGTVRVLSAEGRISAKILIALPFLLGGFLLLFKRGYLNPLVTTGVGIGLLIGGVILLTVGAIWLNRLVKIEV